MFLQNIRKFFPKDAPFLPFDILIGFGVFFSLFASRPDFIVIGAYILLFPYIFFTGRKKLFPYLLLSSIFALAWVAFARDIYYDYQVDYLTLAGVDAFPLAVWAVGLFFIYLVYTRIWGKGLAHVRFAGHLLAFFVLYITALIFVETVAFHFFGIRIDGGDYGGLPFCECLHAPVWVKAVYLAIGPLYFSLAYFLFKSRNT